MLYDPSIKETLADMLNIMREHDGLGIAAPQIGINKCIVVLEKVNDSQDDKKALRMPAGEPIFLINPRIISVDKETDVQKEGCLSLADLWVAVERPVSCRIAYINENGHQQEKVWHHRYARCIQHEIDHLEGRLLLDYLSPLKKRIAEKKLIMGRRMRQASP